MKKIKMNDNTRFTPLTGQFLVAVPGIDDERFNQAVVYVYTHSETDGAQGIVINKPAEKLLMRDILAQLKCPMPDITMPPLLLGGPDRMASGFILHSSDYHNPMTYPVTDDVALTSTHEILHDIANGQGPNEFLMALGCATWRRGQLEDELMSNVWLTVPATHQIMFHTPNELKWEMTLKSMGIDPLRFSTTAGKA